MSGLARVTAGDVKEKTFRLVDPARCRMWDRHNRRYELLSTSACSDLLESLRSQGEQEFPAIVRRVKGDPEHDYEVICGARRHWSVSYLRTVEHRDIAFLIEERDLTDEAAFRLADLENRSRLDISDYERALDYSEAIALYYGGNASQMAKRLEMSDAWLSRLLDLTKLPAEVVSAFGDIRQLRSAHARVIKPLLTNEETRPAVLRAATEITEEQAQLRVAEDKLIEGAVVVARLKRAALPPRAAPAKPAQKGKAALFTATPQGRSRLLLDLNLKADASNEEFVRAFAEQLAKVRPGR
jgi:ParB family chromosome partitioning protein